MATVYADKLTLSPQKISEIIAFEEVDSRGGDCHFIDMKNGWGIKCYELRTLRNVSYACQKAAALFGLAPDVGKKFNIVDEIDGGDWFCHLTEVVKPVDGYQIDNCEFWDNMPLYEERIQWCADFEELTGCEYADNHVGNFGLKDGELVCIDWDKCYNWYTNLTGKKITCLN